MKTLVSLLIIFLIPFISSAQSQDWKEIESPFETSIYILHQTSHGYLFGKMNHTNQIFFSNDRAVSWRQLSDDFGKGTSKEFLVREDINGQLYHANNGIVSHFNPLTLASVQILQFSESNLLDFSILNNGNFLVATIRNLFLYSVNGELINQHEWFTHTAHFLLDKIGQKHFVLNSIGATDKIIEFNENLSFIGPAIETEAYPKIVRNGNKLFRENQFSEDGVHWQNLNIQNLGPISAFNVGHNRRLLIISYNSLYTSFDGNFFQLYDIPISGSNFISADKNGELVVSISTTERPTFSFSKISGVWQYVNNDKGVPFLLELEAGVHENLFTPRGLGNSGYSHKKDEWSSWILSSGIFNPHFKYFQSLPDGSTLGISNDQSIYETKNNGEDWELRSDFLLGSSSENKIDERSGILYFGELNKMHYSSNFGKDWETIISTDSSLFELMGGTYILGANYSTYYLSWDLGILKELIYYNWLTGDKMISPANPEISAYTSSYNQEVLYGLKNDTGTLALCISSDHGTTFTLKKIEGLIYDISRQLKTDHLKNIYAYTSKQIFISKDEGDSWTDISPDFPEIHKITNLDVSFDNYLYVSTIGKGILKFNPQLADPVLKLKSIVFETLTAFPNPANGLVYISGEAMSDKLQNLMIYDIHGKLILSQKINQHDNRIDISKCTPGTYILMMKSGERVYRGKLLKM